MKIKYNLKYGQKGLFLRVWTGSNYSVKNDIFALASTLYYITTFNYIYKNYGLKDDDHEIYIDIDILKRRGYSDEMIDFIINCSISLSKPFGVLASGWQAGQ